MNVAQCVKCGMFFADSGWVIRVPETRVSCKSCIGSIIKNLPVGVIVVHREVEDMTFLPTREVSLSYTEGKLKQLVDKV